MQEYTVTQVSRMTGVSVRALHHYDAIGLLRPARTTEAGYRLYDEAALRRLQNILLLRELEFPLRQIAVLLDSPGFDPHEALEQQIQLLELRLAHTRRLIALARQLQQGGNGPMDFTAFDKTELRQYAREAQQRWGRTAAYAEYEERQKTAPAGSEQVATQQLMEQFSRLGRLRTLAPDSEPVQQAIAGLQQCISTHWYTCTDAILQGLGEMYTGDARMQKTIDDAGGEGTAAFAQKAIAAYCAARGAK